VSDARRLLGRARHRIGRALATSEDEQRVTAEHWGEEAREKAESEDWRGLYWQSDVLTTRHINRAISGDPDVGWLPFTKQRFFSRPIDVALSLGCGYGIVEREGIALGIARRFDAYDISEEAVAVAREEAEKGSHRQDSPQGCRPELDRARAGALRRRLRRADAPLHRGPGTPLRRGPPLAPARRAVRRAGVRGAGALPVPGRATPAHERFSLPRCPSPTGATSETAASRARSSVPRRRWSTTSTPPSRSAPTRSSA
jgi:SAM-dependent methyltransferase